MLGTEATDLGPSKLNIERPCHIVSPSRCPVDEGRRPRNRKRLRRTYRPFREELPGSRFPTFGSWTRRPAECRRFGEGHARHECARAHCPGRVAFCLVDRIGWRSSASTWSTSPLGRRR